MGDGECCKPGGVTAKASKESSCCRREVSELKSSSVTKQNGSCCSSNGSKTGDDLRGEVSEYYGQVLKKKEDLLTNACCTGSNMPSYIRPIVAKIHDEVVSKYYGCGFCVPEALEGASVLDLGSGAGRDCYILSALVGESGTVVGLDMTDEQLEVANGHRDYHTEKFGYRKSNVEFRKGYIEKLGDAGLGDATFHAIISNCVVNLSPDKEAVLLEAYRVLKTGGEMYFSDVYSHRRIPVQLRNDSVLFGECISGALYWNDFISLAKKCGFSDPRVVSVEPFLLENDVLQEKVGEIRFSSVTVRLFKLPDLDDQPEDYGLAVRYLGTISSSPNLLHLDRDTTFETGRVVSVSGNTYTILRGSRFAKHFEFFGDFEKHFGPFRTQTPLPNHAIALQ